MRTPPITRAERPPAAPRSAERPPAAPRPDDPMPIPTIRHADAGDAPAIVALIDQHVATGALLPRSREFVADRAADFLVATLGDELVGCVHLSEYSPSLAEVRSLAVDAAHRSEGIDALLLAAAERLAARREYATLFAVTNDAALFESRGYRPSA